LRQSEAALRAARDSIHQVECCSRPGYQLRHIQSAAIDLRRSTFLLQKLRGRAPGFEDWYLEIQELLRADPLMKYFHDLRTSIEKEGLPGPLAELYFVDTGEAIADVACFEDEHGLAVSGAVGPAAVVASGEIDRPTALRSFRLPDPPTLHDGSEIADFRFASLATQAADYLESRVLLPAKKRFGEAEPRDQLSP